MSDKIQTGGVYMEQQGSDDLLLVEAYGDGGFRLRGRRVEGSVLLVGDSFFCIDVEDLSDLTEAHFEKVFSAAEKPEILFVGTGAKMQLLPAALRRFLEAKGLMPELMDTGAAARTLNVLRMEDRRVAALLLQVA